MQCDISSICDLYLSLQCHIIFSLQVCMEVSVSFVGISLLIVLICQCTCLDVYPILPAAAIILLVVQ